MTQFFIYWMASQFEWENGIVCQIQANWEGSDVKRKSLQMPYYFLSDASGEKYLCSDYKKKNVLCILCIIYFTLFFCRYDTRRKSVGTGGTGRHDDDGDKPLDTRVTPSGRCAFRTRRDDRTSIDDTSRWRISERPRPPQPLQFPHLPTWRSPLCRCFCEQFDKSW